MVQFGASGLISVHVYAQSPDVELLMRYFPQDIISEQLFVLQVPYHATSTAPLSTHDVRLPKESTVGDLLDALMQQLPADKRPKELRLLEIFNGKIYQVSTKQSFGKPAIESSCREQLRPE
jgi:hypothetical protein